MIKTLLAGVVMLGLCSLGQAQSSKTTEPGQKSSPSGGSMSVTGCLEKGSGSGSYTITGADGKKYDLRASDTSLKLDTHVGHKVTITGTEDKSGSKETRTGQSSTGGAEKMDVSSLTMVSTSCQ